MDLSEAYFDFSYDDGQPFSYTLGDKTVRGLVWVPGKEIDKEITLIHVHGLGDWLTRNKDLYKVFVDSGFTVIGTDHLGHGKSDGKRCDTSVYEISEEIICNINYSKDHFPYNKIFIWGHSLGGLALLYTTLFRTVSIKGKIKGIICESPWLSTTDKQYPITLWESIFLYISNFIKPNLQISVDIPESKFEMPDKFIELTKSSPYNFNVITPKLMVSAFQTINDVRAMSTVWPKGIKAFFAFGKKDETLDIDEMKPYIRDIQLLTESGDVTLKTYNGYHALTKCKARKELLTDVFQFIDNIMKQTK